jgi:hypothetical protein
MWAEVELLPPLPIMGLLRNWAVSTPPRGERAAGRVQSYGLPA